MATNAFIAVCLRLRSGRGRRLLRAFLQALYGLVEWVSRPAVLFSFQGSRRFSPSSIYKYVWDARIARLAAHFFCWIRRSACSRHRDAAWPPARLVTLQAGDGLLPYPLTAQAWPRSCGNRECCSAAQPDFGSPRA